MSVFDDGSLGPSRWLDTVACLSPRTFCLGAYINVSIHILTRPDSELFGERGLYRKSCISVSTSTDERVLCLTSNGGSESGTLKTTNLDPKCPLVCLTESCPPMCLCRNGAYSVLRLRP
jgi:hypothetical protein